MYNLEIIDLFIYHYSLGNKTISQISNILTVSKRTLYRWKLKYFEINKKKKDKNEIFKERIHGSKKIHKYYMKIENFVKKNKGCTLNDIKEHLNNKLSNSSICRVLKFQGITRKRIKNNMVCKDLEEIIKDRKRFYQQEFNEKNFLNRTISLDETSFTVNDHQLYGYSKKGVGIRRYFKHKRIGERYSLLCAIDRNKIIDCKMVKGGIKSEIYLEFLKKNEELFKGKIILQDNAKIHHSKKVKEFALEKNIEMKYIPPYSPEFNPIELIFSKMKTKFRSLDHNNLLRDIETSIKIINQSDLEKCYYHTIKCIEEYR